MDLPVDASDIEPCLLPLLQMELHKHFQHYIGRKHTKALAYQIQADADSIADSFRGRPATLAEFAHATYSFLTKLKVLK